MSWRYVPTEATPADKITYTGTKYCPTELSTDVRYRSAPKFLRYESAELWPENKVKAPCENDEMKEKKKERWAGASQENKVLLGWKTQTKKSYNYTAYVKRFAHIARG